MERTIMVADTKTQKRYKITTNASTLGELKQTLAVNNIDYSGMSFTEGITKTTLQDDSSPLPTNVSYKGSTTNNLVILLTNTRKNIASGLDRKEVYRLIKEHNLQEAIEEAFGRNFTQVSTAALETFLDTKVEDAPESCPDEDDEEEREDEEDEEKNTNCIEQEHSVTINAGILQEVKDTLTSVICKLNDCLNEISFTLDEENDKFFSEEEIDKMLADL